MSTINSFVYYLNSMNNANSSSENALAESQILTEYYDKIRIDRRLGEYIYQLLFDDKPSAVILTGHAGDGKTSVLVQILNQLGYFDVKKPLKEREYVNDRLFYVKDMSELSSEVQGIVLEEFLLAPSKNFSSILISNTGPLINTFKRILKDNNKDEEEIDNFEMKILDLLDKSDDDFGSIDIKGEDCKFRIINMAQIENTYFVKEIIEKILNEELWEKCQECNVKEYCPIYFNYKTMDKNRDRIISFIERLYLWFFENQSRLTIRQMLSHISFSITGNLNCNEVHSKFENSREGIFDYAFSNLFFGYKGYKFIKNSNNIKAIRELRKLNLDEIALVEDYNLFVKEEFDIFDNETQDLLETTLKNNIEALSIENEGSVKLRRSFRRFYILLSNLEEEFEFLISQVFSDTFNMYFDLKKKKSLNYNIKAKLKDIIFEALYKIYLGIHPIDSDKLYLTLKKNYDDTQNVQLILGELSKTDIDILQKQIPDMITESGKSYETFIKFGSNVPLYKLDLQTLDYFNKIREGAIFTSLNPSFTFGLMKLKTNLIRHYRYNSDEEIKLLVIRKNKIDKIILAVEENTLHANI
ncbi:hypothetical protein RBH29_11715 [Herbivorax sp. ANBcel31]|uniref:hypothetical protein n=1 Tax=Herbivorax sp. ANBcel31 TaxID=3069754 RepID=UPI0027B3A5D3|nr:hypothetical protein [Herbivorax sp. ANBcel31]MDQ2087092.1 hypothetical protein [Herbivorax sp. ANBcel31]